MYHASIWLLLLICSGNAAGSSAKYNWLAEQMEKRLELQATVDSYVQESNHRRMQLVNSNPRQVLTKAQVSASELPQRVRIAPFDLLLAPTPIQLKRADEDLLLVDLQELIILFMRTQFGHEGSLTNRMGADTTLEYVLFSDIEENSWSEGKKQQQQRQQDQPRTVLRFNGGVASFVGPDVPSEDEVNEWVESAINGLFVAALAETEYNYIELTQYMIIADPTGMVHSGDLSVTIPSESSSTPMPGPQPVVQAAVSPSPDARPPEVQDESIPLFYILVSLLIAMAITAVILALWIRHNNRAVRVLCLSSREKEEIVDFGDDSPISISHETERSRNSASPSQDVVSAEDDEDTSHGLRKDARIAVDNSTASLQHHSSMMTNGTNGTIDEASSCSTSEFTIPTVSALSFRNPNPFGKGLQQESFQKERKTYISKDMLYSSWSGKAPSLDGRYGRRHDDSVLEPSYFSAAKEWEHLANLSAAPRAGSQESGQVSQGLSPEPEEFRFEAATEAAEAEDAAPDGIYMVSSQRRMKGRGTRNPSSYV